MMFLSRMGVSIKNKTKLVRKRSAHRFRIFLKYHLKREEKEPIFIITTRRTGSNLLLDYLNSIPGVSFAPEVLNKSMFYGLRRGFAGKSTALRHIAYSINACSERVCGAKLIMSHLHNYQISMEDLKRIFPNARFIILYRRSILDQFVSLRIAEITDTWQWTKDFDLPSSIKIDVRELLNFCRRIKWFYQDLLSREWLKERSIVLSYEEFARSPQDLFERTLFPFLGLPVFPVSCTLRKQNTKELREIVSNYEELTPWITHSLVRQNYGPSADMQSDAMGEAEMLFG